MTGDVTALIAEARELSSGRTLDEYDVNPWIDQSQTALSDLADALEAALADAARLREVITQAVSAYDTAGQRAGFDPHDARVNRDRAIDALRAALRADTDGA